MLIGGILASDFHHHESQQKGWAATAGWVA
jgi:hypothetical protein